VNYGSLWQRWARGVSWIWINERFRGELPDGFERKVMTLHSADRLHIKQGRSTSRIVLDAGNHRGPGAHLTGRRPLAVYLKRHSRLPWQAGLAALFDPAGRHSPAAAEWRHLDRARRLGLEVPEAVAAGEWIGPRGDLQSFLMVAELSGCEAVNELLPRLSAQLDRAALGALKRRLVAEMARIAATLHSSRAFHKDFYLCHFFVDLDRLQHDLVPPRVVLIDLHRFRVHRLWAFWWRWKDLGQLLFSTFGVAGIDDRDRLRFWWHYRRRCGNRRLSWQAAIIRIRAARYRQHNRTRQQPLPDPDGKSFQSRWPGVRYHDDAGPVAVVRKPPEGLESCTWR
jgi:heptose I phosphotransferase